MKRATLSVDYEGMAKGTKLLVFGLTSGYPFHAFVYDSPLTLWDVQTIETPKVYSIPAGKFTIEGEP